MDPVAALRRIGFLLEREHAETYRVKAYRTAALTVAGLDDDELARRVRAGTLTDLQGLGPKTAGVVAEAAQGHVPAYLQQLEDAVRPLAEGGEQLRGALRGDLHTHSDWSDGGSPIEEMAVTAIELGHEYMAVTDHSPRLTVANGLSAARLRDQLDVVARLGERLGAFCLLSGIEVDILEDGALDQEPELLAELGVVVASVHSKLRMESAAMTRRMLRAVANPDTDVLGHCTGRTLGPRVDRPRRARASRTGAESTRGSTARGGGRSGRERSAAGRERSAAGRERSADSGRGGRPPSEFDAHAVFTACAELGVAVEINCRPERQDPPDDLLSLALDIGCLFSIDTDGHAPGQLDWQVYGCARAEPLGVPPERVVNTWPLEDLRAWTRDHRHRP
ncbi:MAG: PHP domain-containing protein [Actinomycetes bacterium]